MKFKDVPNFLFTKKCIFCGKYGDAICDICIRRIEKYQNVKIIKYKKKNVDLLIYFFKYEKLIRKLILSYKFFNQPIISEVFGKIMLKNEKICRKLKFCDIIISVPMHSKKKQLRGYNQTELLSSFLASNLNLRL